MVIAILCAGMTKTSNGILAVISVIGITSMLVKGSVTDIPMACKVERSELKKLIAPDYSCSAIRE